MKKIYGDFPKFCPLFQKFLDQEKKTPITPIQNPSVPGLLNRCSLSNVNSIECNHI